MVLDCLVNTIKDCGINMLLFFLKKPLVVDAFCPESYNFAYELAPIDYSHKFYPNWWKTLPTKEFDWEKMDCDPNMKKCNGFLEYYQNGFMIPMWSDVAIKTKGGGAYEYRFSDQISQITHHGAIQRNNIYDDYINLKINSPWVLKSSKGVKFHYSHPFWNNEKLDYFGLPGTLDFYYQYTTHINMLCLNKKAQIMIPFGRPMAHILPLTERKVVLKKHLVTDIEMKKIRTFRYNHITFIGKYNLVKKTVIEKEKKCPFGFKK